MEAVLITALLCVPFTPPQIQGVHHRLPPSDQILCISTFTWMSNKYFTPTMPKFSSLFFPHLTVTRVPHISKNCYYSHSCLRQKSPTHHCFCL